MATKSKKTAQKAAKPVKSSTRSRAGRNKTAVKPQKAPTERETRSAAVLAGMESGKSLRKSCDAAKVTVPTFLRWVDEDPRLAEQYTRARARLLDVKAEELEEIGEQAAAAKDPVKVSGLRLQSDNRKWLLSKLAPKKYGDRVTHQGDDDAPPIQMEHGELSPTQRASRLSSLLAMKNRAGAST